MPDNIPISLGSGASLATDQVGGLHYPYTKIASGVAGEEHYWAIINGGLGLVAVRGNITIDSLPNITVGSALPAGDNNIGNVDIASGTVTAVTDITNPVAIKGNLTLSNPNAYIGLATITPGRGHEFMGLATVVQASSLRSIAGNLTLSNPNAYIGLATVTPGRGHQFMGLVTVVQASSARSILGNITLDDGSLVGVRGNITIDSGTITDITNPVAIKGNLTLSNSQNFIGLATVVPAYGSNSTVFTGIISGTGNTTVAEPPASNRFFIKNLHISSLATASYEVRSGATTIIPFTYTNAGSGIISHYGEMGLPARAQDTALVIGLNGAATISYMFNVRYAA